MSKSSDRHPLLDEIEAFLAETGISETTLGQRALGNWKLVASLRAGRDITTRNAQRLREWMASPAARSIVPRNKAA